jgi:hypothetical protein
MLVVVGLTVVLLLGVALARRRRDEVVAAAAGLALLAAGLAGGGALNSWLLHRNYDGPRLDETRRALSSLESADGIVAVLENLAGQGWYLLVATLGLGLLVLAREAPPALARLVARRAQPADALLGLVVLATAGLLLASALWFSLRDRPDQLVYGRYIEPMAPVLVALGIVALVRGGAPRPRLRALVIGLGALTVVVAAVRAGLDLPVAASRWNVASLPSVTGAIGAPIIVLAGIVAAAALSLLALVARRVPRALGPVALALFAPTTAYAAYLPVLRSERDVYPAGWTSPRAIVEQRGATRVAYDLDSFDHIAVKAYQWALPETRFVLFSAGEQAPPAALFFSGPKLSGAAARRGATVLWRDPGREQVLWRVGAP